MTDPQFVHREAFTVAGMQESYEFDKTAGIPAQWSRFSHHFGKVPGEVRGAYYGLSVSRPLGETEFDYLTAAEIKGDPQLLPEFHMLQIPAHEYAVFTHEGHISEIGAAIRSVMTEWFRTSGHKPAPPRPGQMIFFERYTDAFNPNTGRGGTELWFPLAGSI